MRWAPSNARGSSGGESRLTRGSYGSDEVYTRFALNSLKQWKWLSRSGRPARIPSHRHPVLLPEARGLRRPVAGSAQAPGAAHAGTGSRGAGAALSAGELEGHRSRPAGAELRRAHGASRRADAGEGLRESRWRVPHRAPSSRRLPTSRSSRSSSVRWHDRLRASNYVFACGPWLPKVFPRLLGPRIFVTRQEVFFFAPPAGDARFGAGPAARLGGLQQRRHLLRHARHREPRIQDRARQARHAHRSGSWRSRGLARRAGGCARVHGEAVSRCSRMRRSTKSASASTRTAAMATCSSIAIPRPAMCCWWARAQVTGSSMVPKSGVTRPNC